LTSETFPEIEKNFGDASKFFKWTLKEDFTELVSQTDRQSDISTIDKSQIEYYFGHLEDDISTESDLTKSPTESIDKESYYSDISTNFEMSPTTSTSSENDEMDMKNLVRNILTNFYDQIFFNASCQFKTV